MSMSKALASMAFSVVGSIAACSRTNTDATEISWSLADDIASYRRVYDGQSEMILRVDTLAVALESKEYSAFLGAIRQAPPASGAIIYYEAMPSASHYVFALAAENSRACVIIVSDRAGVRESECRHVPTYAAETVTDLRAIRDPAVAGLVQIDSRGAPRRAFALLSFKEPPGLSSDAALFDEIERTF